MDNASGNILNADVDPDTLWGPLRGECFDKLGFALLYMDYLEAPWPNDQRGRVIALCREVAQNAQEPNLDYWKRMRTRIMDETENMC